MGDVNPNSGDRGSSAARAQAPVPASGRSGPPAPLPLEAIDAVVVPALEEDRGTGDITSENVVPAGARARARLVAKGDGWLAGTAVFARVFALCDPASRVELLASDGDPVTVGQELARIDGDARALLLAERTALNLIQRMSGIATLTARFVDAAGGRARVLDTRKTQPNMRALEKYAVRCGGGENHRFGLFDEAMIKENHLDLAGCDLTAALERLRAAVGPDVRITAEARDEDEARAAARGGADVILLDNMSPERMGAVCQELRDLAAQNGRPVELEASGNLNLDTVPAAAACGVDRLSVGALTHSAPALDLSLYLEPCA